MKPNSGSPGKVSFQVIPPTDEEASPQYFFPEWVTEVFYGNSWHVVKPGSFKEGIGTDHGAMSVYADAFSGEAVFLLEVITGFKVKTPEPVPPPEPQASVTQLFPE